LRRNSAPPFVGISAPLRPESAGIICLTPENVAEPWILFEAGALSKTLEKTFVCTYLIGIEAANLEWPLAMFQATKADKESTRTLLQTINKALDAKFVIPDARLNEIFEVWWPRLEAKLESLPKPKTVGTPQRDTRALLEELITLTRNQMASSELNTSMLSNLNTQVNSLAIGLPNFWSPSILGGFSPFDASNNLLMLYPHRDSYGRQYRKTGLFTRSHRERNFEWRGYKPPETAGWKFPLAELERLLAEGRIEFGETPQLIEYAPPLPAPLSDGGE
jgi:hypothetical protein